MTAESRKAVNRTRNPFPADSKNDTKSEIVSHGKERHLMKKRILQNIFIQLRKTTPILLVPFVCFGLLPTAKAAHPPPAPDGGYPNGNTAEGTTALFSLTTGQNNTGVGEEAFNANTTGAQNTTLGFNALYNNITI